MKSYNEMLTYDTFLDRLKYLQLFMNLSESPRSINTRIYKHPLWAKTRKEIIKRDLGFDLGFPGVPIDGSILVHHINPLTIEDVMDFNSEKIFDPNNLITVSYDTHNRIHYFKKEVPKQTERKLGDTKLW